MRAIIGEVFYIVPKPGRLLGSRFKVQSSRLGGGALPTRISYFKLCTSYFQIPPTNQQINESTNQPSFAKALRFKVQSSRFKVQGCCFFVLPTSHQPPSANCYCVLLLFTVIGRFQCVVLQLRFPNKASTRVFIP
jgi:hypothetical protein